MCPPPARRNLTKARAPRSCCASAAPVRTAPARRRRSRICSTCAPRARPRRSTCSASTNAARWCCATARRPRGAASSLPPAPRGCRERSVQAEATSLALAGATSLVLAATGWQIRSTSPVSLLLDLAAAVLTVRLDSPGASEAQVTLTLGGEPRTVTLTDSLTVPLDPTGCAALKTALAAWLGTLRAMPAAPIPARETRADSGWTSSWTYDSGTRRPERVRNFCVTADPLPVDAAPDQLIDPVMPDGYSREIWTQWPKADHYTVALTFPAPRAV